MSVRTEGGASLAAKLRVVMDVRSQHQLSVSDSKRPIMEGTCTLCLLEFPLIALQFSLPLLSVAFGVFRNNLFAEAEGVSESQREAGLSQQRR